MGYGDDISDASNEWTTEEVDLIPIEGERARFGRYVLCYEIAAGGMGTVYLGREQGPGGFSRPVAIKRIHPHLARKRQFVEMFLDEARVAARVSHPNVCSIYGFGEVAGTHYIAMEYLAGQPLSEVAPRVVRRSDLAASPRWHALAARIVADASEGLHAAHDLCDEHRQPLGIVHRDVSTHNVFVTYDGAVKVLDFGIARAHGRTHQTRTGMVKGKLAYMSPEQARASKVIDRRSDVWSLGVVLWELLTLRRMFGRRSDVELLRAVAEEPIVPPSLVRPEVPPELDVVVLRALERDPERRYPTARALARDLGAFVSRSGESTGLAELSEILGDLFAEERAGKLLAVAATMHTGTQDRLIADPKERPAGPQAQPGEDETYIFDAPHDAAAQLGRDSRSGIGATPVAAAQPVETAQAGQGVGPSTARRAKGRALALGVIAAAILSLAVLAVALMERPREDTGGGERARRSAVAERTGPSDHAELAAPPSPTPASPTEIEPAPDEPDVGVAPADPSAGSATVPEVAAPARRPRRATGVVNVATSGGWAAIHVRGRFVARTPHAVRLPAGEQTLELRPFGDGPPRRVTVQVRPGAITRVVVPLSP